jgi:hypothetical protein
MHEIKLLITIFSILFVVACESGPKELKPVGQSEETTTTEEGDKGGVREVTVKEVLQAEKYTYLNVEEEGEVFWIAVSKQPAVEGDKFYFTDGLLKKNFFSREFDRNFETLYLVSRITPAPGNSSLASASSGKEEVERVEVEVPSTSVALNKIFASPENYRDKEVTVTGQVIKANYQIMNRNWYHIEDGTEMDGKKCDLTITSGEQVPLGSVLTLKGKISLNKDFGAGYKYEIIMEDASMVK